MKRITTLRPRTALSASIQSCVLGLGVVPALALTSSPASASYVQGVAVSTAAVAAAAGVRRVTRVSTGDGGLALVCGLLAVLLFPWVSDLPGAAGATLLLAVAVGLLLPAAGFVRTLASSLVAGVALCGLHGGLGVGAVQVASAALILTACVSQEWRFPGAGDVLPRTAAPLLALPLMLLAFGWIGANSAQASWFGDLTSAGPRDRPYVALTFDDGPNGEDTLRVADILREHGASGTFFVVGRVVEEEPDVLRALAADGDVIGNHSYVHSRWGYLDPRYPELDQAERAIRDVLGVCPAYYRPPHGAHTPLIARLLSRRQMRMATWDVQANDWTATDATRLARSVLEQVRPGSIVLLHDGLDGVPGADRSVLFEALPLILDGLRERGLQPVTLDRLLGGPAYLDHC